MTKGDNIEERMIRFGVRVMKVCNRMPKSPAGKYIADQLLRSGLAPSLQYAEGRSAESKRDFIHKLRIALKEQNEARVCLKLIIASEMFPPELLGDLLNECEQLCRILQSSIQTAQASLRDE